MTYTEDALVEKPAITLFAGLGWDTVTCWNEAFGSVMRYICTLLKNPLGKG